MRFSAAGNVIEEVGKEKVEGSILDSQKKDI
jgi:hypothetical protein